MSNKVLRSVAIMEVAIMEVMAKPLQTGIDELFEKYKNHPAMQMQDMLRQYIQDYNVEKMKGGFSKKMMDAILQFKVVLKMRDKKVVSFCDNKEHICIHSLKWSLPYDYYEKELSDSVPIYDDEFDHEFMPDHLCDSWNDDIKEFCVNMGFK